MFETLYRVVDVEGFVSLETNRYSVPENLIGKKVEVQKHLKRVLIFWQRKQIAEHPRLIDQRGGKNTLPGHHLPLARARLYRGPCHEEKNLLGNSAWLDQYVAGVKKSAPGRGVRRLRELERLRRDYPPMAFEKALNRALTYGLYDLARLEQIILEMIRGDFFHLRDEYEED